MNPDVREQLDDLRSTVEDARSRPMSHSVVVNRDELLETLDKLERAIAAATAESDRVLAQREEVLAEGEAIAIELVRQAELRRDALVSDSEVFRVGQHRADELLASAHAEAAALRADVEAYIGQRFATLEESLERTLTEVRRGVAQLNGQATPGTHATVLPHDQATA